MERTAKNFVSFEPTSSLLQSWLPQSCNWRSQQGCGSASMVNMALWGHGAHRAAATAGRVL